MVKGLLNSKTVEKRISEHHTDGKDSISVGPKTLKCAFLEKWPSRHFYRVTWAQDQGSGQKIPERDRDVLGCLIKLMNERI